MASRKETVQKLQLAARQREPATAGQKRARSNSGSPQVWNEPSQVQLIAGQKVTVHE